MTLDAWRYNDPLEVAMREEAETCKGCVFEELVRAFGETHHVCTRKRKYGKRCKEYRDNSISENKARGI